MIRTILQLYILSVWYNHPQHLHIILPHELIDNIPLVEHHTNPVIHPETGEATFSHENWFKKETWTKAIAAETNTLGTNNAFLLNHDPIKNIP